MREPEVVWGEQVTLMTRFWWTCFSALVVLGATETPAYACSCARIQSFQQRVQAAPVVVVGQVTSVREVPPPQVESAPNLTVVRPPFIGAGVRLAIASVAKGEVAGRQIRVWDLSYGSCGNDVVGLTIGTAVIAAIWRVSDTPATERAAWGAASFIPESDYFASGACGRSIQMVTSDEVTAWSGRKIPPTHAGSTLDGRLPSTSIPQLLQLP
jgi:hypothetical protein